MILKILKKVHLPLLTPFLSLLNWLPLSQSRSPLSLYNDEHVNTDNNDCPTQDVFIVDCGEIPEGADDGIKNFFKDGDNYPDWPADLDQSPNELSWWTDVVDSIKALGNEHFKVSQCSSSIWVSISLFLALIFAPVQKQDYKMALRKYRKALQYLDECWEKDGIDEGHSLASLHPKFSSILKSDVIILLCKEKCIIAKGQITDFHK